MPAVPGETTLTTLFADVHYYFTPPTQRPAHDRFARASYVYLYHNPETRRSRLEIANHAGTPDQDAFAGDFDSAFATAIYSYKQPNLCTLTVAHASPQDHKQWHIPSFDEHNDQKRLCKIHALDLYLFTEKDAALFLRHLSSLLPADRMDIRDAPVAKSNSPSEHRDSMSHVVQRLEHTAISTPRAESVVSSRSSLPGPPTPASSGVTASPPMAYNPAAPSAPEPIAYREKTPPPPDDGTGTGLSSQPSHNAGQPYRQQGFFPSGPQQQYQQQQQPGFGLPSYAYAQSVPGPPGGIPTSPPPQQHSVPSFGPMAPQTPGFPQSTPPAYGLHTPLQSPGLPPPPPFSQQHQQQQQPAAQQVFSYSNYTYTAAADPDGSATTGQYDIHNQAYRPTAAEAAHGHGGYHGPAHGQNKLEESKGRQTLEGTFGEVDKRVAGMMKWFDKKL